MFYGLDILSGIQPVFVYGLRDSRRARAKGQAMILGDKILGFVFRRYNGLGAAGYPTQRRLWAGITDYAPAHTWDVALHRRIDKALDASMGLEYVQPIRGKVWVLRPILRMRAGKLKGFERRLAIRAALRSMGKPADAIPQGLEQGQTQVRAGAGEYRPVITTDGQRTKHKPIADDERAGFEPIPFTWTTGSSRGTMPYNLRTIRRAAYGKRALAKGFCWIAERGLADGLD